jgi:hypothetical protein
VASRRWRSAHVKQRTRTSAPGLGSWSLPDLDEGDGRTPECDYLPEIGNDEQGPDKHRWHIPHKREAIIAAVITGAAVIVAAIIGVIPSPFGSGDPSAVTSNRTHNGDSACNGATITGSNISFNCAPTGGSDASGSGLSSNPRARIVELTGSWSAQGFVDAIVERETSIVALYLKTGMNATTLHEGASAILWGFQGVPQNGDPVALVKTFQADGFKVDDELQDNYLMQKLTDNYLPLQFDTNLTPKGYTGGYQGGAFVGSLLFWIVQRATWAGPTAQDIRVIKYLISQGADCKVPLSFFEFNSNALVGASPYKELLPMMQSCAN